MGKLKLGAEFFISALIALVASSLLFCIILQQEAVDNACVAIENHDQDAFIEYVNQVWNIDDCGTQKETMLMVACKAGNTNAIEYLLQKGADPNKTVPGKLTPLELFCNTGYAAGEHPLILLLEYGVRQSVYTVQPAIFYLANNYYWMTEDQKDIATEQSILLLQHGAPLGYSDTSLLHIAAKNNMADLFYTMVHTREGLSMMNMKNGDGKTPWDVALSSGAIDVQKVIRNLEIEYQKDQNQDILPEAIPTKPTNEDYGQPPQ